MSGVAAFFDMDKTLIAENSATLYMKHRYEQGEVSRWDLAKGLSAYLRYKVGALDLRAWTQSMMLEFKGRSEAELRTEGYRLFDLMVKETIYPEAADLVAEHHARGHTVAIVSGATRFIVEPMANYLGVGHIVYTRLEAEDGVLTGRVVEPICFDEGKIYWIQQLIEEQRIDLARSYFYTDSVTDLPLLDLVGHPIVTNPDPILYRTAVRRRWPVRFFKEPEASGVARSGWQGVSTR
jgi:putative phosphoserine phosphatase/1-acylglycerol-3-phosphate O-acyltransferase